MKCRFVFFWVLTLLVAGCTHDGSEMRIRLSVLEQANLADSLMLNDSLAEMLVSFFDDHGTPNERVRAHYILGRTYTDLGEYPRALEAYYDATNCADTLASDCDFAKLSRVHAQLANIFYEQIQPRSQLKELHQAEYYAIQAHDTLMAVECYTQQADAYSLMHLTDSVIFIKENAARLFEEIGRSDRAAQTVGNVITSLLKRHELAKAKKYIDIYEESSGFFDEKGNISSGHKIYYYIKGEYYLAVENIDSAEYMFRKELREATTLNHQIAGSKGLQTVFEHRKVSDSIAKYANLGYILNDSAYSLAEMQNIQKFQASYNYNHNRYLAEQKKLEAKIKIAWLILALVTIFLVIIGFVFFQKYYRFKKAALDYRLKRSDITCRLKKLASSNPSGYADFKDWRELRILVEHMVPSFRQSVRADEIPLSDMEYDVCLAIRVGLQPQEIANLKKCSPSQITKIRKNLLQKIFLVTGGSDDFDDEIGKIGGDSKRKIFSLNFVKSFSGLFLNT